MALKALLLDSCLTGRERMLLYVYRLVKGCLTVHGGGSNFVRMPVTLGQRLFVCM